MPILKPGTLCVIIAGCPENIGMIVEVIQHVGLYEDKEDAYLIRTTTGRHFHQLWSGNDLLRGQSDECVTDRHKLRPLGLDWSGRFSLASVPAGAYPALYRIFDAKAERLLYIGETQNFGQRMKAHGQKNWSGRAPVVSYHRLPNDVLKVHLHELENDLIGGYYEATGDAPEMQFSGGD